MGTTFTQSSTISNRKWWRPLPRATSPAVCPLLLRSPSFRWRWERRSSSVWAESALKELVCEAARCSGVSPPLVWAFSSAPCLSRRLATATRLQRQALWRGVHPSMVCGLIFAPAVSKAETASTCPLYAARCRGVYPSSSQQSTSDGLPANSLLIVEIWKENHKNTDSAT